MGDEQNRLSFCRKVFHNLHKFVDFLRGKDCRRLVKNQNFVVAVQHFQNFDALLHTDRNIFDNRVGINHKTVLFGKRDNLFARLFFCQKARLIRFRPKDNVVKYAVHLHKFEVLMHHTYAKSGCVVGIIDFYDLSVFQNFAFFGLIQAEQHRH